MTTDTKQATCGERIGEHMASRMADLKVLFRAGDCEAEELKDYLADIGSDDGKCSSCDGTGWVDAEGAGTTEDAYGAVECGDCDGTGIDRDAAEEAVRDEMGNYGLAFDFVAPFTFKNQPEGYWRYQLSYGGPADEVRFYGDANTERPHRMEYWFLDWFDGASRNLTGDNAVTGRAIWSDFQDCGTLEATYDAAMEDYEPEFPPDEDDSDDDEA